MKNFKTTEEIAISNKIIDQVIGQDKAADIIKKAAKQKRNVLLIGPPGTGKSMLAQAMAELMPKEELEDVLVYPNYNNENQPLIRTIKTFPDYDYLKKNMELMKYYNPQELMTIKKYSEEGKSAMLPDMLGDGIGRRIVAYRKSKEEPQKEGGISPVFILLVLAIIAIAVIFLLNIEENVKWMVLGVIFFLSFLYFLINAASGFTKRFMPVEMNYPKLIVDNTKRKTAPFIDATGARAGALLGDVKHDPLQCFFPLSTVYIIRDGILSTVQINKLVDELLAKYPNNIERDDSYEGLVLPKEELIYTLGYVNNEIKPVRIVCINRRMHEGRMVVVKNDSSRLVVTPEHKIYVNGSYIEAERLKRDEHLMQYREPILTADDIIKTFSKEEQKATYDYYRFIKIKEANPEFDYKRIAKILGLKADRLKLWDNKTNIPRPVKSVERLEALGLLPFKLDNKNIHAISRILGASFGNSSISSMQYGIFFSSSDKDLLDDYAHDLIAIFGESIEKKFERTKSRMDGRKVIIRNTDCDVVRFFVALGAPTERMNKKMNIPSWIYLNEEAQKEFFGALLGMGLHGPIFSPHENKIQYFEVSLAGDRSLRENRITILKEIACYLNSYGIKTSTNIDENECQNGRYKWKLSLSCEIENILRFYRFIPIRYSNTHSAKIQESIERMLKKKISECEKSIKSAESEWYTHAMVMTAHGTVQKIVSEQQIDSSKSEIEFSGAVYNITTESGNLFANGILVSNSGGLGTPAHLRVEAGAVHAANKGVLFIDEIASLKLNWQQELLTAMQEKRYPITGQSEMSSGALVKTEPAPTDFVLVGAGNLQDLQHIHPALRSRILGSGYEIYVEDSMDDNPENEDKLVRFVAQEVKKDGKIPHFTKAAVEEIIEEARRLSGRRKKFTLNLRHLGGLVRAAGDIAKEKGAKYVEREHVVEAKKVFNPIEQQLTKKLVEQKKEYQIFMNTGFAVGRVNGLAVLGDTLSGLVLPLVAEVTPPASKSEGKVIATGKLGTIAKEAVENVSAIIKKHIGTDISKQDIHIQFLQTYEGVEGDSASISIAVAVISAMEGIAVNQSYAMTGSLDVRGRVLPVGGITGKIEAAIDAGMQKVIIPKANAHDIYLSEEKRKKIEIIEVGNIVEVLKYVLKNCEKKKGILTKMNVEFG